MRLEAPDKENTTDDAHNIQENIDERSIAGWDIGLLDFVRNGNYKSNDSRYQKVYRVYWACWACWAY